MYKSLSEYLSQNNYEDYSSYLQSDLWKTIKNRVILRDRGMCQGYNCSNEAYTVHHMSYLPETMSGDNDDELISVCESCHQRGHANGKGSLARTNRWILTGVVHKPKKLAKIKKQQNQEAKWARWRTR